MAALTSRLGWLAAVLVPPSLAAATWRDAVARHPVSAAAVTIAYWAVVAAAKFAGGVLSDLGTRWRKEIVDWVHPAIRRRLSGFGARYRRYLLGSVRLVDFRGLLTRSPNYPELDEVYVDVSLASRAPNQVPGHLLAEIPASVSERHDIWDLLDRPRPLALAVIGAPGSGKTTLLRHTVLRVCRHPKGRRRRVPVLLFLRDHVTAITAEAPATLPELVVRSLGQLRSEVPPDWFQARLKAGDCLVLLDGLDEVATDEHRKAVSSWIVEQRQLWPDNDYVITSRPDGYRTTPVEGATTMQVRQFTDEQVDRFVRGWYLAIERHAARTDDEDVRIRARDQAEDLLERLDNAPALIDLTANPLLLTMIATVHQYRGALPGSRAGLYREICEVMLWRRQEAKRLELKLGGDKKQKVLRHLAYSMMDMRVRDLSKDKVLVEIRSALRRVSKTVTPEEFLADVGSNGLLLERESGLYTFAHLTFQEFLAAAHMQDSGLRDVTKLVEDAWWRETLLLYAATANADPIVAACLRRNTIAALALAFECADQGSDIALDLQAELDQLMSSSDMERRRLLVGVMAIRYLHHSVPVPGGRVCVKPVPPDLFRAYLQAEGLGTEVDLIHAGHATRFPRWLNEFSGHDLGGRLPTSAQLDVPVVRRRLLGASSSHRLPWLHGGANRAPVLGTANPHSFDHATMVRRMVVDLAHVGNTLAQLVIRCANMAPVGDALLLNGSTWQSWGLTSWETQASSVVKNLLHDLTGDVRLTDGRQIESLLQIMQSRFNELDYLLGLDLDTRLCRPLWNTVHHAVELASVEPSPAVAIFRDCVARSLCWTRAPLQPEVPFESLENMLASASADMSRAQEWRVSVSAARFAAYARPYLSFRRVVTPDSALLIRLAALILATQAETYLDWHASVNYRMIAAGITVLEERECGVRPEREMLVLALP